MGWYRSMAAIAAIIFATGCAGPARIRDASDVRNVSGIDRSVTVSPDSAAAIIATHTIAYTVPNPLAGGGGSGTTQRFDPSHEPVINCRAVLLDAYTTEADILAQCAADSLDEDGRRTFREHYVTTQLKDGMFRIRITMESGFSPKSMEPEYWVFYVEGADDVMVEPHDIIAGPVTSQEDSVRHDQRDINVFRRLMRREVTLYFKERTFYGEDLLKGDNPYVVLVMAREQRTVARIVWQIRSAKAQSK